MNNIIKFIKNNISVFSGISALMIIFSTYKLATIDATDFEEYNPRYIYYFIILFALVVLLFDRMIKKIFAERIRLNIIQLFISIAFIIVFYFKYLN